MPSHATVYIVDDDPSVRSSLGAMLTSRGFRVASYPSGTDFLDQYDGTGNGCVLMDIVMPGPSGLDVLDQLASRADSHPIIVMTGRADVTMATRALESGAFSFLEKPFRQEDLLWRIESAVEHDSTSRKQRLRRDELRQRFSPLTPREREILDLVVAGRLTKQIAVELGISQRTVETHRGNIMNKLHANSLAELVAMTIENQIAPLPESSTTMASPRSQRRPWREMTSSGIDR